MSKLRAKWSHESVMNTEIPKAWIIEAPDTLFDILGDVHETIRQEDEEILAALLEEAKGLDKERKNV